MWYFEKGIFSFTQRREKPCKLCCENSDEEGSGRNGAWTFVFEGGATIQLSERDIECSCASGTTDCCHLRFLFNKVLKLRELGETLYDYGDVDAEEWATIQHHLSKIFENPRRLQTTTCPICFEDLHGIHNLAECNHVHKVCLKIAGKCPHCI